MELQRLIDALSDASAYPHPVGAVEARHTHISVVFLAGAFAYKVKKPVALGFLDFGTPEQRRHFCEEEVRLNRRLAPDVYLGVVPIASAGRAVRVEGAGEVVEWAVKMRRLDDDSTLGSGLRRGEVAAAEVEALARRVDSFHRRAEAGARVSACASFAAVARNARENLEQAEAHVGRAVSRSVFDRCRVLTEGALKRIGPLVEERAHAGKPRDTHGDLRLDHVYRFPDRPPPDDFAVIDCIEFDERFRFADPVADVAFLIMDLKFNGRPDLAGAFADAYFRAAEDDSGRPLLGFYTAYRAAVRAKVESIQFADGAIPEPERHRALAQARGHWLLALGELEGPNRRPGLVLVGGLPGTGKSTLARALADTADFRVIRSDVVRKELAGLPPDRPAPSEYGEGIYAPRWTERTYSECLARAEARLFEGERVVVDASFAEERWREAFLGLAARLAVPGVFLVCQAGPDAVRSRLESRRDDPSDADWPIHRHAAHRWEEPGSTRGAVRLVDTRDAGRAADLALAALRECSLGE